MDDISVVLTEKQISRLKLPMPRHRTNFESWIPWANEVVPLINDEIHQLKGIDTVQQRRLKKSYEKLLGKLSFFTKNVDDTWVWYPEPERWEFKPVWVSRYAGMRLWRHAASVLCMSATILDAGQYAKDVGLKEWSYQRLPNPFPKENRPVYYQPVVNLRHSQMNGELPKLSRHIDYLLQEHADQKVLVHTANYEIARYLMENLSNTRRLMSHESGNREQQLQAFKETGLPAVMISPSMDRGVDLPDDLCRVVIVAKMPFAYLGDPQIKRRVYGAKDGNHWYAVKTIRTVHQMVGRGVRSKSDWCTSYILDEQFERLYRNYPDVFLDSFKEALID